jgi:N6-adenosine-specific RNA methylase IME4
MATNQTTIAIDSIVIGDRHRRDMGNIAGLAASIADVGLLQPVVVTSDGKLIAGERRVRAAQLLGWSNIAVNLIDLDAVVRGEFAENFHRKAFTPSEMVAIAAAIEPIERAKAKERQLQGTRAGPSEKFSEGSNGRALDNVAAVAGVSRPTLIKAREVIHAAEQDPDRFEAIKASMDATGKVDHAFRKVKNITRQRDLTKHTADGGTVADLKALADSGYRASVVYADPPWPFETWSEGGKGRSADNHYNTLPIDELAELPVADLAADNTVLFLWCTWPHIALGSHLAVIKAWGFEPKTVGFVWVKKNRRGKELHTGMGYWTRANSEVCLIATRGAPKRMAEDVHQVIFAPVGEHSAKPEEVRRRIERLVAGPYLELYGRRLAKGWTVWGNEIPATEARDPLDIPEFLDRRDRR